VAWTGSNNWSDRSLRADEVTIRIPIRSVYRAYVGHWNFIRTHHSAADWKSFHEPSGGGRAPAEND
jgi:hypothetical protein